MTKVTVNSPRMPVTKGSSGVAAATLPNVCKMPGPPAPFVPTPLPNIGKSGDSPQGYSKTVTTDGNPVAITGASFGSQGDMASKGTGGGLISSNTHGPTKFLGPGSMNVKIEGKNVQLLSDPMLNNCGPSSSPANAATMTGIIQASRVMAVIYCTKFGSLEMRAFVEFVEKHRPGFSKEIVPAEWFDILILEKDAGPLPGVYRRFLETMGASMGDLELAEASFSIDGVLGAYSFPWLKGGRYVYFARDKGINGWDWFLDRLSPHGPDDCLVVNRLLEENYPPEGSHPMYVGLEEFLYYEAFKELRLPQLPFRRKFSSPEAPDAAAEYRSDAVTALAEEKGFKRIPPAEHCALYERGDAALLLYRHPTQPTFSFVVGCEDAGEMEQLAKGFETRMGLKGIVTR